MMDGMRRNQFTGNYSIFQPNLDNGEMFTPHDRPVMLLINHGGILQRVDVYGDCEIPQGAILVYESLNPVVSTESDMVYGSAPQHRQPAYGYHYLMVSSDDGGVERHLDSWTNILVAIQDRMRWLYAQKKVGYVAVFADLAHPLDMPVLQMATFQDVPPVVANESRAMRSIYNEMGLCAICQIVRDDAKGPRQVIQTKAFAAFCPWSPSCPYEFWVMPKKHNTSFVKTSQLDLSDMALMMRTSLGGVRRVLGEIPCSLAFHMAPERKTNSQLHWHVEVYPHTSVPMGLERGFGITVNNVSPEDAASTLGSAARGELVDIIGID